MGSMLADARIQYVVSNSYLFYYLAITLQIPTNFENSILRQLQQTPLITKLTLLKSEVTPD